MAEVDLKFNVFEKTQVTKGAAFGFRFFVGMPQVLGLVVGASVRMFSSYMGMTHC